MAQVVSTLIIETDSVFCIHTIEHGMFMQFRRIHIVNCVNVVLDAKINNCCNKNIVASKYASKPEQLQPSIEPAVMNFVELELVRFWLALD